MCNKMNLIKRLTCLDLETARSTATTSTLEFASLGTHIRFDSVVGVWVVDSSSVSKVSECLTGFRSSKEDGIGSLWSAEGELIKGEAFSSGSGNALASVFGEGKCADSHLWDFGHTNIIRYFSNKNCNLFLLVGHVLRQSVKSHWWLVGLTHVQTLKDGGAKLRFCSACQELVQFDQKTVVRIRGLDLLHGGAVPHAATSSFDINTHVDLLENKLETRQVNR